MSDSEIPVIGQKRTIKVNDRVVGHLSRGLYRSPASAIRELVSNAWDAGATEVIIDTSCPRFKQITVADNGSGFSLDDFARHMAGDIGNSAKRFSAQAGVNDRPIIGRLGIGMLGIGQICHSFTIASKVADGTIWQARVSFRDELKERLDEEYDESKVGQEYDIGNFELIEPTFSIAGSGTILVSDDLHPAFVTTFAESTSSDEFKKLNRNWSEIVSEVFNTTTSLQLAGEYVRLLWEMGAACPVPYISRNALPDDLVSKDHQRLMDYNFKVIVDGTEIRKPIALSGNEEGYVTYPIAETKASVFGKDLQFHGYLIAQNGKQLKPDETRGVLIRIKNIGIGYYDQSFMDYRTNEGPRSRWVTGEIYVDSGLENSLNIDRDSFNKFDPEYRELQKFLHKKLQSEIFSEVNRKQAERSERTKLNKVEKQTQVLEEVVNGSSILKLNVDHDAQGSLVFSIDQDSVESFSIVDSTELKTKKSAKPLAAAILTIYDISQKESSPYAQREKFQKLLLELLKKW